MSNIKILESLSREKNFIDLCDVLLYYGFSKNKIITGYVRRMPSRPTEEYWMAFSLSIIDSNGLL